MFPIIQKPVNWFALQINGVVSKWWGALVVNGLMKCKMTWSWVYTIMYVCVSEGKKCSFFGKFGVLCFLEKLVLRFALLPYYPQLPKKSSITLPIKKPGLEYMINYWSHFLLAKTLTICCFQEVFEDHQVCLYKVKMLGVTIT